MARDQVFFEKEVTPPGESEWTAGMQFKMPDDITGSFRIRLAGQLDPVSGGTVEAKLILNGVNRISSIIQAVTSENNFTEDTAEANPVGGGDVLTWWFRRTDGTGGMKFSCRHKAEDTDGICDYVVTWTEPS